MADIFNDQEKDGSLSMPYSHGEAVVDDTPFSNTSRALWVGGLGDVDVDLQGGDNVVFTAVPAGTLLEVRATVTNDPGTTATNIVALW
jgi:hypothetical protein